MKHLLLKYCILALIRSALIYLRSNENEGYSNNSMRFPIAYTRLHNESGLKKGVCYKEEMRLLLREYSITLQYTMPLISLKTDLLFVFHLFPLQF